jgi:type II secretory pathway pseudopilin PulG
MRLRLGHTDGVLRDQRGFTLVELLVVMASGIVVASALFTILDVTLRQTTRTFSRVDATQRARNVMETIESQMHSSCVSNKVRPILPGSTGSSVSFWSQYGKGVELTPVKRTITFDSGTGKLTETEYPVASGSAPNWVPSLTASSTTTLLTNVAQSGATPVFRYYELKDPPNPSPLTPPLSGTNARKTALVEINLVVKPTGGTHQTVDLAANTVPNSVSLRLTPAANPDSTQPKQFFPCE